MTGPGYGTRVVPPTKHHFTPRTLKKVPAETPPSWDVSDLDRLLAGNDPRQLHFDFYANADRAPELNLRQANVLADAAEGSL